MNGLSRYVKFLKELEQSRLDQARWRWARSDPTLWKGTYDFGVSKPEDADQIADESVAANDRP